MRLGTIVTTVAVVLASCAQSPVASELDDPACAPVERPMLQDGGHLIGDAAPPIDWSSIPATSGWHASGNVSSGLYPREMPITDAQIVTLLEAAGVVLVYDPARVDALTAAGFAQMAGLMAGQTPGLTVAPYVAAEMPEPVSLLAWGTLTRCTTALRLDTPQKFSAAFGAGAAGHAG